LEGLKNREVGQEGNVFTPSLFLSFNLFGCLMTFLITVLANNLKATQQSLSDEKSARLMAENSLAKERATRQAAEQSCQQSNDANAILVLELETAQTSLVATRDKLNSKSKALDFQVIRVDEAVLRLKNAKSRLEAAEEDLKNQKQLLDSARKTSSKREDSFNMMIFSAVAHAAALFKNHLPDLNMELLRQDFTVDDAERETLVSSAFDAAQDFIPSYDFTSFAESDDNNSHKDL
jgi:chromosome segregation ATPase